MNHSCVKWSSEEPKTAGVYLCRFKGAEWVDCDTVDAFINGGVVCLSFSHPSFVETKSKAEPEIEYLKVPV